LVTFIAAVLAAGAAAGGTVGVALSLFGFCLVVGLWTWRAGRDQLSNFLGLLAFIALVVAILAPSTSGPRPVSRRAICANNMKQLGAALSGYQTARNGGFPPVWTTDVGGKPLCSWRELVLPYLERNDIYQLYRRDEPWDSQNNSRLSALHLELFGCPSDPGAVGYRNTSYVAIVGTGTIWRPGQGVNLAAVKDGAANTILLVEMRNSGIKWAEPRDLDLNNLPPGITQQNLLHTLSNHAGGFDALFIDGHVEFIPETISWRDFMALLTIVGGETVDRSKW
jgi:prepilin-type processing-associated H-X9-DG protein